jgi:hypothetical protein
MISPERPLDKLRVFWTSSEELAQRISEKRYLGGSPVSTHLLIRP